MELSLLICGVTERRRGGACALGARVRGASALAARAAGPSAVQLNPGSTARPDIAVDRAPVQLITLEVQLYSYTCTSVWLY